MSNAGQMLSQMSLSRVQNPLFLYQIPGLLVSVRLHSPLPPSDEFLTEEGSPTASLYRSSAKGHSRHESQSDPVEDADADVEEDDDDDEEEDDGFGDDFDDFEQGQEGDDEDFGDFDDGFQQSGEAESNVDEHPTSLPAVATSIPPIVSFKAHCKPDQF